MQVLLREEQRCQQQQQQQTRCRFMVDVATCCSAFDEAVADAASVAAGSWLPLWCGCGRE
jgi:hypothetical protein